MKLERILRTVDHVAVTGPANRDILGIAYDSRQVQAGCLFVALQGQNQDGRNFIADAVSRGAAAVVSEPDGVKAGAATHVQVRDSRRALAEIASAFYNDPSGKLQMVGVTGTNGKTTVTFIVRDILRADDRCPGLLGTIRYEIGSRVIPAARTTPEAPDLQAMLSEMLGVGCRSAVMEVSSHSLVQKRVSGIAYDVAVFTNLTHEHLDFHGTMEEYFAAKCILFRELGYRNSEAVGVVNADDPWGRRLLAMKDLEVRLVSYGSGPAAEVRAEDVRIGARGSELNLRTPWGDVNGVRISLMGRFNVSNALGAIAACGVLGVRPSLMADTVSKCQPVPGRLDEIPTARGFRVFVDYAHTADALDNALRTLRETAQARLLLVFGCGGNRDKLKRPAMGSVAASLADYSVLTSDNPRKEDPLEIIAQIREGFAGRGNFEVLADRAQAIRRALEIAGEGDTVLVAGKGHETFQEFANTSVPFDDRQVARQMLQLLP